MKIKKILSLILAVFLFNLAVAKTNTFAYEEKIIGVINYEKHFGSSFCTTNRKKFVIENNKKYDKYSLEKYAKEIIFNSCGYEKLKSKIDKDAKKISYDVVITMIYNEEKGKIPRFVDPYELEKVEFLNLFID